jgi:hypothetical protein
VRLQVAGESYSNSLGRMETGVLLQQVVGAGSAGLARGWDGDRFALIEGADGPALVWFSVWDDADARDRFAAALRPALGKLPRAATLEVRDVDGRAGALLSVGTGAVPTISLAGGQP